MGKSAVVINHRVALAGTPGHSTASSHGIPYIANRPMAAIEKTQDDLRIERQNELMKKVGYIAFRPGSVPERNSGHALFDQWGVPARVEVQRALQKTKGAIITSVVSVRREDADAVRLSTRQDWERLLRGRWADLIASTGVMPRDDVRWCAAVHYHPDGVNIHAHVYTWSASGDFNRTLPRRRMVEADRAFVDAVLAPRRVELNLARTQARDDLVRRLRSMRFSTEQAASIVAAIPAEGCLKYAALSRCSPVAVRAVDECVDAAIASDSRLRASLARWRAAVTNQARLKSLSGARLEAHVAAAESDMRVRMGNAVISAVFASREPVLTEEPLPVFPEIAKPGYASVVTARQERQERALREEVASCLSSDEIAKTADGLRKGISSNLASVDRVPAVKSLLHSTGLPSTRLGDAMANAARGLGVLAGLSVGGGRDDSGEASARAALMLVARAMRMGFDALVRAHPAPSEKAVLKLVERM